MARQLPHSGTRHALVARARLARQPVAHTSIPGRVLVALLGVGDHPVGIAVLFSFNAGRSRSTWQGFSLRWYVTDPDQSVLHDPLLHSAVLQSLKLAGLTMAIATPIGVALALGLTRWRGRVSSGTNFLMLLPLVTPEIVLASGLLLVFAHLYTFGDVTLFGTPAQLMGHVTWSIPYVVVVMRGRLFGIGPEYEEAAMDLGARPTEALYRVVLPLLAPAIFAAFMIVFALSIDDFVTSQFLFKDQTTITIPMLIYGTGRTGLNPSLERRRDGDVGDVPHRDRDRCARAPAHRPASGSAE